MKHISLYIIIIRVLCPITTSNHLICCRVLTDAEHSKHFFTVDMEIGCVATTQMYCKNIVDEQHVF